MARGPLAVKPRGIECRCVARQNIDSGLCYMQCNCCFADSDSNIQLHVSPLVLLICRQFDVSYTSHLLPNIVHTSHFFTISTVLLRDRNRATSLDI